MKLPVRERGYVIRYAGPDGYVRGPSHRGQSPIFKTKRNAEEKAAFSPGATVIPVILTVEEEKV